MTTIEEIEAAIRGLPESDLTTLRAWFARYDAERWDEQFERDVAEGRLDALANETLQAAHDGRCTEL